jgi:hypothetical protein
MRSRTRCDNVGSPGAALWAARPCRAFRQVSFDGSWAALSAGGSANPERLLLQAVPSDEKVYFGEGSDAVHALAFHPRRLSLAVSWRSENAWLDVYEQGEGGWKRAHRRAWAYCPQWTDAGLAFAAKDGFHVVDGARSVAHVPFSFQDLAPSIRRSEPPAIRATDGGCRPTASGSYAGRTSRSKSST